jgi:hypothetical protein
LVRSCDSCSIPCRWNSVDVTGERSDQRRQLPVALAPAEAAFRLQHPGGTPAVDHLGVAPPLHFLVGSRAVQIMRWKQLVLVRLAASRPPTRLADQPLANSSSPRMEGEPVGASEITRVRVGSPVPVPLLPSTGIG